MDGNYTFWELKEATVAFYSEDMDIHRDNIMTFNFGDSENIYTYCKEHGIVAIAIPKTDDINNCEFTAIWKNIFKYGIDMSDEQIGNTFGVILESRPALLPV